MNLSKRALALTKLCVLLHFTRTHRVPLPLPPLASCSPFQPQGSGQIPTVDVLHIFAGPPPPDPTPPPPDPFTGLPQPFSWEKGLERRFVVSHPNFQSPMLSCTSPHATQCAQASAIHGCDPSAAPPLVPGTKPYSLLPMPYALHPTPYALLPTHYTIHSTPYTLHPTPYAPTCFTLVLETQNHNHHSTLCMRPRPLKLHETQTPQVETPKYPTPLVSILTPGAP